MNVKQDDVALELFGKYYEDCDECEQMDVDEEVERLENEK